MRFIRFRKWLEHFAMWRIDLYIYEMAHHRGGPATELCVGFTTRIIEEAARRDAQHIGIHTATLKKWATGSGKASKEQMMKKAELIWGVVPDTHDIADALLLLAYGMVHYAPTAEISQVGAERL